MQVEEIKIETPLTRQFTITVPADDIEGKVSERLAELGKTVKMPGFRPGHVPANILRKQYGPRIMGEVLERALSDSSAEVMKEKDLRPAMQPQVKIENFDEGKDLVYSITIEIMPDIEPVDFAKIKLENPVVALEDSMVDEALERIAAEQKVFEKTDEDRASVTEDALLVDFTGRVDGVEFPGGAAKDFQLELDSQNFIPGFIEQVVGAKPGENRKIKVTFPTDYGAEDMAGKDAEFEIDVKELRVRKGIEINDELAKAAGLESLDAMKDAIRERMGSEYGSISRNRLKRSLLDQLADLANFEIPARMADHEFAQIWQNISGEPLESPEQDHEGHDHGDHEGHDHGDQGAADQKVDPAAQARFQEFLKESGKTVDELKEEYRGIAARRVRLGLLLTETGRENNITVADEELNRAVVTEAQRFPGQEQQVVEFYQKDPAAREQLRAPLFEDKVIDFVLELASVSDKSVTADELMAEPGESAGEDEGKPKAKAKKKAAPKKAAPKKAAPKKADAKKKAPAKKKEAKK
nr:trigger factor [Rhodospirillales bacterium]